MEQNKSIMQQTPLHNSILEEQLGGTINDASYYPDNQQRSLIHSRHEHGSDVSWSYSETSESTEYFQDLIGYDCFFLERARHNRHENAIDRFIPNRKESQYDCLKTLSEETFGEQNQQRLTDQQPKQVTVAEIYRKHILRVNLSENADTRVDSFVNRNNLRFSSKTLKCKAGGKLNNEPKTLFNMKSQIVESLPTCERKINKVPFKVLDAPNLQDDFYLNLIDWSMGNVLAVALNNSVYLWHALSSRVNKLCEVSSSDTVTSLVWSPSSNHIAVGTSTGTVQLWDANKSKIIRCLTGHTARVGSMSWNNNHILSSGSKDKMILNRDTRDPSRFTDRLIAHKQQVCGLKWSFDGQQLASGGNDNKVFLWNLSSNQPINTLSKHSAAVKALAWSPHQYGLLASGGGTADKTIRFWNTLSGEQVNSIEVGSQVCNIIFSKTVNELVSTHGYSLNQVNLWKYPRMEKLATLSGHSFRVLYLAMSPDGSTIVTGAGDQTLRFWNIFPSHSNNNFLQPSELTTTVCLR